MATSIGPRSDVIESAARPSFDRPHCTPAPLAYQRALAKETSLGTISSYRVYKLNPAGRIVSGDWVEAIDDRTASEAAYAMCDEATPSVELWQGTRRVAVLSCHDDAA